MAGAFDSSTGESATGKPDESKAEDDDEEYEIAEEIEEVVERLLTVSHALPA